jgi:7-cyano-7-deazaguanine synthase in queuosine biosynthesis
LKGTKRFLIKSGTGSTLSEADSDYTIVVDDYRTEIETEGGRLIKYKKKVLNDLFSHGPPPTVTALVELALGTYAADRLVRRGPTGAKDDGEKMLKSRQIQILYPVVDVEKWQPLESELNHAVSFISRDNFQYRFIDAIDENQSIDESDGRHRDQMPEADSVALFSGGLDSLGGRFHLADEGYNPHFVSVDHGRNVGHLVRKFDHLFDGNLTSVGVDEEFSAYEDTQFTRSFMYFAFAAAVAVALDADDIYVPENGVLSRFSSLESGWTTTRTVHPLFIKSLNRIFEELFPDREVKITNPFLGYTKKEVVDCIPNKEDIFFTRTCPHPRELSQGKNAAGHPYNCGECIPCLIRIIGLVNSEHNIQPDELMLDKNHLLNFDFSTVRVENIAQSEQSRQSSLSVFLLGLNAHLSFAYRIQTSTQKELVSSHPELLDPHILGLYEQFSREIFRTVKFFAAENPTLDDYVTEFLSLENKELASLTQ